MPLMLLQKILSQLRPLSVVRQRLCFRLLLLKVRMKAVVFSGVAISEMSLIFSVNQTDLIPGQAAITGIRESALDAARDGVNFVLIGKIRRGQQTQVSVWPVGGLLFCCQLTPPSLLK